MLQKPTLTILNSDCLVALKTLPDNSVHCCITSPPYYGLRDYKTSKWEGGDPTCDHANPKKGKPTWGPDSTGTSTLASKSSNDSHERKGFKGNTCPLCGAHRVDAQIGLEETPQQYVDKMVEVFREVRRVLRGDGVCWLNLGDSYSGSGKGPAGNFGATHDERNMWKVNGGVVSHNVSEGLKPQNLLMIPARVVLALQADGWTLRGAYPWIKRNGMPESVKSRPSQTIEQIFMLTKSERYFYDAEAVKKPLAASSVPRLQQDIANQVGTERANGGAKTNGNFKAVGDIKTGRSRRASDWFFESWQGMMQDEEGDPLAFVVNTKPYRGAHFAVFPAELIRPMVASSTSSQGCCAKCGAPQERIIERVAATSTECPKTQAAHEARGGVGISPGTMGKSGGGRVDGYSNTLGWKSTCECVQPCTISSVPCTVLDPFGGSGTTAQVALEHGCNAIVCELNPDYVPLIHQRCDPILNKATESSLSS